MNTHYKAYIEKQKKDHKKIDHRYILQHCDGVDKDYLDKYMIRINHSVLMDARSIPIREEYLDLILNHKCYVDRWGIDTKQKVSIGFYKAHKDEIYLSRIVKHQKLSENDIKEILDDIINEDWLYCLFEYQILSESFLRSIKEYWINEACLKTYMVNYNKLSTEFRKEFDLDKYLFKGNWLYKSTEFKKEKLIETNLYECFEDHFIAYKAIRKDRYSIYDFQYQYLKNGIYEAKANYDINDDVSFGLSVGTKEHCKKYGKDYGKAHIIVKCKVYYDDIAAVIGGEGKVRCTKIQILD